MPSDAGWRRNAGRARSVDRLLIDECLSQSLVALAKERGLQAEHVVWLGKAGVQDWSLVPYAIERNDTLVTNNRRDFLHAYTRHAVHDGLIIVVPAVRRLEQLRLFGLALYALADLSNTVNKLVEVFSDGEVRVQDWSSSENDAAYVHSA